jgi:hypothetical protein|tara:strand:+ start:207 stop:536 length:330 start_codon:yes stop_codon:yes gene_type:complete
MRKILTACALIGAMTSVASAAEFKSYAGGEYQTESEKQKLYVGTSTNVGALKLTVQANMLDTKTVDWTYSGLDLDLSIPASESISLYMKNDINDEWERTETTLGFKWTF